IPFPLQHIVTIHLHHEVAVASVLQLVHIKLALIDKLHVGLAAYHRIIEWIIYATIVFYHAGIISEATDRYWVARIRRRADVHAPRCVIYATVRYGVFNCHYLDPPARCNTNCKSLPLTVATS